MAEQQLSRGRYANILHQTFPFPTHRRSPLLNFLNLLMSSLTHNGSLSTIMVMLTIVAGTTSSLTRYEFMATTNSTVSLTTIYTTMWVSVLAASLVSCLFLLLALWRSQGIIVSVWRSSELQGSKVIVAMVTLWGCGSVYAQWSSSSEQWGVMAASSASVHWSWQWMFYCLHYTSLAQSVLSCVVTIFVFPVARSWAQKIPRPAQEAFIQLFPWRTLGLIQHQVLQIIFFRSTVSFSPVTLVSQNFIVFNWLWILVLACYITSIWFYGVIAQDSSVLDVKNAQVVSGLVVDSLKHYPAKSELVRGTTSKRFEELLEPNKLHQQLMDKEKEEEVLAKWEEYLSEKRAMLDREDEEERKKMIDRTSDSPEQLAEKTLSEGPLLVEPTEPQEEERTGEKMDSVDSPEHSAEKTVSEGPLLLEPSDPQEEETKGEDRDSAVDDV